MMAAFHAKNAKKKMRKARKRVIQKFELTQHIQST